MGSFSVSMMIRFIRRTANVAPLPTVSPISPSNCLSAAPITFDAALVPNDISEPSPGTLSVTALLACSTSPTMRPMNRDAIVPTSGLGDQPLQRLLEHGGQGQQLVEEHLDPLAFHELPQWERLGWSVVHHLASRARRCR